MNAEGLVRPEIDQKTTFSELAFWGHFCHFNLMRPFSTPVAAPFGPSSVQFQPGDPMERGGGHPGAFFQPAKQGGHVLCKAHWYVGNAQINPPPQHPSHWGDTGNSVTEKTADRKNQLVPSFV